MYIKLRVMFLEEKSQFNIEYKSNVDWEFTDP